MWWYSFKKNKIASWYRHTYLWTGKHEYYTHIYVYIWKHEILHYVSSRGRRLQTRDEVSKEAGKESEESKKIMASSKLKTRQHAQRNRCNLFYFQMEYQWKVFLIWKKKESADFYFLSLKKTVSLEKLSLPPPAVLPKEKKLDHTGAPIRPLPINHFGNNRPFCTLVQITVDRHSHFCDSTMSAVPFIKMGGLGSNHRTREEGVPTSVFMRPALICKMGNQRKGAFERKSLSFSGDSKGFEIFRRQFTYG